MYRNEMREIIEMNPNKEVFKLYKGELSLILSVVVYS